MGAAPPGVLFINTIFDSSGVMEAQYEIDYDTTAGPLTSASPLTGASVTNVTGRKLSIGVWDMTDPANPVLTRTVSISKGTTPLTKAQLARAGYSTVADCNGITFI